jgi:hypothetical protein
MLWVRRSVITGISSGIGRGSVNSAKRSAPTSSASTSTSLPGRSTLHQRGYRLHPQGVAEIVQTLPQRLTPCATSLACPARLARRRRLRSTFMGFAN